LLPDFIVIGGQKCGTTSFYKNLIKHPNVIPCIKKQVHFFDLNFLKGQSWYRAHFPTKFNKYLKEKMKREEFVTGEASPYYIFHPHVPKRIYGAIPQVKLIALLRNPVDRAYSHHNKRFKDGTEKLTFEKAIEKEEDRIKDELKKMEINEHYSSEKYRVFSYLSRGRYAEQLERWIKYFPLENMLIIKSEDFFSDPKDVFNRVSNFLNISKCRMKFKKFNVGHYTGMDNKMRKRLIEYYDPHNQKLFNLIGLKFDWY